MTDKLKVFLLGGDKAGWALDTELRMARKALVQNQAVSLVDRLDRANILHTVCPEELIENPLLRVLQKGRPVVAVFSNDPYALIERVPGLFQEARNWFCVAQSTNAFHKLKSLGIRQVYLVPYIADTEHFQFLDKNSPKLQALRNSLRIPTDRYVLGSFQRDSSGNKLDTFKLQKGADIFVTICQKLKASIGENRFHVLLAGPRRHWIRNQLDKLGISYTFDGTLTDGDDFPLNIKNSAEINVLMNIIDTYIVSSRWEGGPRAVLEAATCKTKIISTDVGIASDILASDCIFKTADEAANLIAKDVNENFLAKYLSSHYEKIFSHHDTIAGTKHWGETYSKVSSSLTENASDIQRSQIIPQSLSHYLSKPLVQKTFIRLRKIKNGFRKPTPAKLKEFPTIEALVDYVKQGSPPFTEHPFIFSGTFSTPEERTEAFLKALNL